MSLAVVLALAAAGLNVAAGRWLQGRARRMEPRKYAKLQALGLFARGAVIFGTAHVVWLLHRRAAEVVVVILVGATAQMVGQIYFLLRKG